MTQFKTGKAVTLALCMAVSASGLTVMPALADTNQEPLKLSDSLAGNYLAARIASTDRDMENAAGFYRKVIALDPDNTDIRLKAFLNFIANGDFAEGIAAGKRIVKAGNEPEIVRIILAIDDLRSKNWAGAERGLDHDWRSALDRLMAGLISSWVKIGQSKNAEALAAVDKLKGPAWFDLFAQYHGGLIAMAVGDKAGAVSRLTKAYENRAGGQAARETYSRVIEALATAQFDAGNVDAATKVLSEALVRQPQNPVFTKMLAEVSNGTRPAFRIATAQRGAAEVFTNLGTAIDKEGGQQFARIYLQLARTLASKDEVIAIELAELLDAQGRPSAANAIFESISEESPYYRIARLERALNLDELEDVSAAEAELEKLINSGPDDLVTYLSYGAVLARHEKYDKAAGIYQRIIDRIDDPTRVHWNLFYRQGIAFERTKQWPKAEAAFKQALELFPDQPSVLNYLGYSWVDMNINLQEGLDMIRKAVSLRPNDGYMVDSLGWAYYRLNRFEEAVIQLERAVELRPGDPTINDHLGDAYWKANRKLEATFQWHHAMAMSPPEADIPRIESKLADGLDEVLKQEAAEAEKAKPDNG